MHKLVRDVPAKTLDLVFYEEFSLCQPAIDSVWTKWVFENKIFFNPVLTKSTDGSILPAFSHDSTSFSFFRDPFFTTYPEVAFQEGSFDTSVKFQWTLYIY